MSTLLSLRLLIVALIVAAAASVQAQQPPPTTTTVGDDGNTLPVTNDVWPPQVIVMTNLWPAMRVVMSDKRLGMHLLTFLSPSWQAPASTEGWTRCAEVRHSPAPDQLVGLPPTPPNLVVCDDTGRPMSLSLEPGVVTVITYLWTSAEAGPHCGWRQGTGALKSIPYTITVVVNNQDMYTRQAPEGSVEARYVKLLRDALTGSSVRSPEVKQQPGSIVTAPFDSRRVEYGDSWPLYGQTMVGHTRLRNLEYMIRNVVRDGIEGDIVEGGVWRGGSSIFAAALLEVLGEADSRTVWVMDSFQGLPPANRSFWDRAAGDLSQFDFLSVSQQEVEANFEMFGVGRQRADGSNTVEYVKGFFNETMAQVGRRFRGEHGQGTQDVGLMEPGLAATVRHASVLRIDCDMYECYMDMLFALYPLLSVGGYVLFDDMLIHGARQAAIDFRAVHGITDPMILLGDRIGAFFRKTKPLKQLRIDLLDNLDAMTSEARMHLLTQPPLLDSAHPNVDTRFSNWEFQSVLSPATL